MDEFNIGDWVYGDDWCYGQIMDIDNKGALVEYETAGGGGSFWFNFCELEKAPEPKSSIHEYIDSKMKYYIGESGSSGRQFETWEDFIKALKDLADTYAEQGKDWFEVEVIND